VPEMQGIYLSSGFFSTSIFFLLISGYIVIHKPVFGIACSRLYSNNFAQPNNPYHITSELDSPVRNMSVRCDSESRREIFNYSCEGELCDFCKRLLSAFNILRISRIYFTHLLNMRQMNFWVLRFTSVNSLNIVSRVVLMRSANLTALRHELG